LAARSLDTTRWVGFSHWRSAVSRIGSLKDCTYE
jgi:hypothetical protein